MLNIYKGLKNLLLLFCLGFSLQSCNIINPAEPTPTYIHIDSFQFVQNPLWPGLPATHNISNVWVYYNNSALGAFDLPATIPILANGAGTVELFPGIIIDGLNSLTGPYPFYKPDTFLLTAQPGKTVSIKPSTEYYDAIKQAPISNFEGGATKFTLVGGNKPIISVSNNDSLTLPGTASGSITLTSPADSSIVMSNLAFPVPTGEAYIEFDYKGSLPFYVGLSANVSSISSTAYYLAGIYPTDTWQKFYLSISGWVARYPASNYNFYIKTSMPDGQSYGRLLIENIQLITNH